MKNIKKILFVLAMLLLVLQLFMINQDEKITQVNSKSIVAVSTFSLYDITRHIGKDSIELINILPFGVDAHSFEPTPKLMASLERSRLVIYNGALEPWIESFRFKNSAINMSTKVDTRVLQHNGHHHKKDHKHSTNTIDPHYWLDIENMKIATNIITDALIKLSPKNGEFYSKNRESYLKMLDNLDKQYKKSLKSCKKETIITNHNAFSYLSHRYNFKVESLNGLSPEAQPSAKQISRLMEHIKEHNVSTIFFESFVSDRVMKSIAKDTKVAVDTLQPLGNITKDEAEKNLTYEDIMKINLEKISKALMCQ